MQRPVFFTWRQAVLNSDLPPTARHILLTLSCHMNDAGESCYPSVKTLCTETGLSNRAVCTNLRVAAERGFISIEKHGFGGQSWARNEYRICWPEGSERSSPPMPEGSELASPPYGKGSEPNDKKAVNEVHTSTSVSTPLKKEREAYSIPILSGIDKKAWQRWIEYRAAIKKPLKPASHQAAQRKLVAFGDRQASVVEQSIANGWTGLFSLKENNNQRWGDCGSIYRKAR